MPRAKRKADIVTEANLSFLIGGGEMGNLIRSYDWASHVLGTPENWPLSLKTSLSIILRSGYPMFIWWGAELIMFHNDAYLPVLGKKHPEALGSRAADSWAEIWEEVGQMADQVMHKGEQIYHEDLLLYLERKGYPEETYWTFSYSPIANDEGKVGGLFCACIEETRKIFRQRRLKTLTDISGISAQLQHVEKIGKKSVKILDENPMDVPFACLYLLNESGKEAYLIEHTGCDNCAEVIEPVIKIGKPSKKVWPFHKVLKKKETLVIEDLRSLFGNEIQFPGNTNKAIIELLQKSGQGTPYGFLVAGTSENQDFDDEYRSFFNLICGQITTAIANELAFEEERKRAEALVEVDRTKTLFYSNISHEFRTPLTLMLGPLEELLKKYTSDKALHEQIAMIHRNGLRLLKLVNALLDFSRIEAGKMQASFSSMDLSRLTRELSSSFHSAIENAGLAFIIDCPPLSENIYIDPDHWETIIFNLLSNAYKFTFEGEISVKVREVDKEVKIMVADTGTGIPTSELSHVFSRFHRIAGSKGRSHEGTGIGLAMVAELIKLHGGNIALESEPGKGSTFTIFIPKGKNHLPAGQILENSSPDFTPQGRLSLEEIWDELRPISPKPGKQKGGESRKDKKAEKSKEKETVLVVDDNPDMNNYLSDLLEPYYEVITATEGKTAYETVLVYQPSLVLSDIMMPGVDGYQLLKMLRENETTASIPVILLSARAGEEAKVEGISQGADDYLIKPFSAPELLARIKTHIALVNSRKALKERELELSRVEVKRRDEFIGIASHELKTPLTSLKAYIQLLLDNTEGYERDTIRDYLSKTEIFVNRLNNLIASLLDVSRIQSGKIQYDFRPFNFNEMLQESIENAQHLSAQHRIFLKGAVTHPIYGDRERLQQLVNNLLSNAIKYSPKADKVVVELTESEAEMKVSIKDEGIGIPADQLTQIFDRYTRVNGAYKTSGLGIGLYIASEIIIRHQGKLWVESTLHKGSVFYFTLPLQNS